MSDFYGLGDAAEAAPSGGPIRREFGAQVREVPGRERVLRFTASTEDVARDGDIIRVSGWQTDKFMANPVILWAHEYNRPPVGRAIAVRKVLRGVPRLEVDVEFAGLDQLNDLAESVYLLYRDGFLKAVSVGFLPKSFRDPSEEERAKLGLGPFGRVVERAELLEVSAVPVPADAGALLVQHGGDRCKYREALASVRSAAPPAARRRFDAIAASLKPDFFGTLNATLDRFDERKES